jgi:hypothetical protein
MLHEKYPGRGIEKSEGIKEAFHRALHFSIRKEHNDIS